MPSHVVFVLTSFYVILCQLIVAVLTYHYHISEITCSSNGDMSAILPLWYASSLSCTLVYIRFPAVFHTWFDLLICSDILESECLQLIENDKTGMNTGTHFQW
jgi:hypothetical protein